MISGTEDRIQYWQARWATGQSQWHNDEPQKFLVKVKTLPLCKVGLAIRYPANFWTYFGSRILNRNFNCGFGLLIFMIFVALNKGFHENVAEKKVFY